MVLSIFIFLEMLLVYEIYKYVNHWLRCSVNLLPELTFYALSNVVGLGVDTKLLWKIQMIQELKLEFCMRLAALSLGSTAESALQDGGKVMWLPVTLP